MGRRVGRRTHSGCEQDSGVPLTTDSSSFLMPQACRVGAHLLLVGLVEREAEICPARWSY